MENVAMGLIVLVVGVIAVFECDEWMETLFDKIGKTQMYATEIERTLDEIADDVADILPNRDSPQEDVDDTTIETTGH